MSKENCELNLVPIARKSAADVVQPQHDVVCQLPGKPRIPRPMASCHCLEFEHPGTGAGDRYLVPRTDRACSYHHGRQREEERLAHLAEPGATLIPVLRGWCGCDLHGASSQLASGMGTGAGRIPGHVRDPSLLRAVFLAHGTSASPTSSEAGCGGWGLTTQQVIT